MISSIEHKNARARYLDERPDNTLDTMFVHKETTRACSLNSALNGNRECGFRLFGLVRVDLIPRIPHIVTHLEVNGASEDPFQT